MSERLIFDYVDISSDIHGHVEDNACASSYNNCLEANLGSDLCYLS